MVDRYIRETFAAARGAAPEARNVLVRSKSLKQWVPLFCWVTLIFVGSSIPRLSLGEKFGLPLGADKVAHFTEYLVLALLFYRGLRGERWGKVPPVWLVVVIACLAIGTLDEFHQQFIPGRDANIWDWMADAAGIVSGTLIAMQLRKPSEKDAENA